MQIIKDKQIIEDHWHHLADDPIPEHGCITVSLSRWKAERNQLIAWEGGELGLRLNPNDAIEAVGDDLKHFQLIALEFPKFTDGRGFSLAQLLRKRYRYQGEIRAMGDYLRDQIFFLSRVGVNAFEFNNTTDITGALSALSDFTVRYQSTWDSDPAPTQDRG